MAAQTEDKKLDGAGLSVLWGLIKNIIPTVPTNVSSFTNDAAYVSQLETHNQNLVLASPNGASGLPSFRALAASDIPDLSGTYLTSASLNGYATQSWVTSQGFGTVSSIKVGTTSYSPSSGVVSLPAYPTTLPASDVYSWAKASSKPSYSWSEIGSRPTKLSEFTNDSGFITGITSSMVTTALGFTPANSTSLSSYLPLSGGTMTGNIAMGSNSITGLGGINFSNASGVTVDEYGNIKHKTTTSSSRWHIDKSNGKDILSVTADGNVGIGTASPLYNLHVAGTFYASGDSAFGGRITVACEPAYNILVLKRTRSNAGCGIDFKPSNQDTRLFRVGVTSDYGFQFSDENNGTGTRRLFINSSGNVGIGTDSPSYKLHVNGGVALKTIEFTDASGITMNQYGNIQFKSNASGTSWNIKNKSGSVLLLANTNGNVGIGTTSPSSRLHVEGNMYLRGTEIYVFQIKQSNSAGSWIRMMPANQETKCMIFGTAANYSFMIRAESSGTTTTRLCVQHGGNVGIGTDSPSYKLHVDGAVGATAFTNTSDIRNKDFISDTSMSIEQIANAPSFLFKWKTGDDRNVHAGSSAQYWQTVLPEIITAAQDEQRTLSMQYDVIALLSSITIAREVVNDKERIRQLEQRVSQLEAQLAN